MIDSSSRVILVGATGAVGGVLAGLLEERRVDNVLYAGRDGREILIGDNWRRQVAIDDVDFSLFDVAFLCTPSDVSMIWVDRIASAGCTVVDNSSALRMSEDVPLVVPEINGDILIQGGPRSVIANPNCSTIIMLMAVGPIDRALRVKRIIVSTYQSVSGAGKAAMTELTESVRSSLDGSVFEPVVFKQPAGFNIFSHDSSIDAASGYNGEEIKMAQETEKILDRPVRVAATCVRVPVMRSHCESVLIEVETPATVSDVKDILSRSPGVRVVDDREGNEFPTALEATGLSDVLVGRIRHDSCLDAVGVDASGNALYNGFTFFVAGDQLLKGAALNALQIGDLVV